MPRIPNLSAYLALGLIVVGGLWAIDHNYQKSQYLALQSDYQQLTINAEVRANEIEAEHKKVIEAAQHEYAKRENKILADVAGVSAANAGLRDTIRHLRGSMPTATDEANRAATDALAIVFGECAERYTAVAESADRLANEAAALSEAWPK